MVEEALVESQVLDTVALIQALEKRGESPSSAVWQYLADAAEWRLFIAGPSFDALLPRDEARAYQTIAEALRDAQVKSLTIGKVQPVRTDNPLLQAARRLANTGPQGLGRVSIRDTRVNNIFIKEMLVVRSS
jgi:hypothetical protein